MLALYITNSVLWHWHSAVTFRQGYITQSSTWIRFPISRENTPVAFDTWPIEPVSHLLGLPQRHVAPSGKPVWKKSSYWTGNERHTKVLLVNSWIRSNPAAHRSFPCSLFILCALDWPQCESRHTDDLVATSLSPPLSRTLAPVHLLWRVLRPGIICRCTYEHGSQ